MTFNNIFAVDDLEMANVLTSPIYFISEDVLMNAFITIELPGQESDGRVDIYKTSLLGEPMTLLASALFVDVQQWICLPSGEYQLAFIAIAAPGAYIELSDAEIFKTSCEYIPLPTQNTSNNFSLLYLQHLIMMMSNLYYD